MPKREKEEDYVEWIRRATRLAEGVAKAAGCPVLAGRSFEAKVEMGRQSCTHGSR